AGVDVFRVLAVDRDVQLAGALDRRGNALEPANGPHAGREVELLPERDVDRTVAAADGRRERALDRDPVLPDRLERVLREPDRLLIDLGREVSRVDLEPLDPLLPAVGLLDRGVEDPH